MICRECESYNDDSVLACRVCGAPRPDPSTTTGCDCCAGYAPSGLDLCRYCYAYGCSAGYPYCRNGGHDYRVAPVSPDYRVAPVVDALAVGGLS